MLKVRDAQSRTPEMRSERETLSLIHFMCDQGKVPAEWLDAIAAVRTKTEPVRQRAHRGKCLCRSAAGLR